MADMKDWGLPKHLRKWGLKVEEADGWRTRGRPYNFYPKGILVHHTASGARSGNFASNNVVTRGRPGLNGPLCHFLLGRDGKVRIIADGYANHAGYGGPHAGIPRNQGNTYLVGIEAENNGVGEPWSKKQLNAYYRLCAALMVWLDIDDINKVFGHKEWTGRKIDPAGINMDHFRKQVAKAKRQGPNVVTVKLGRLKPGKRNKHVRRVKRRLARRGFNHGSVGNKHFNRAMRFDYADWQKSLGYKGKDCDGIPGRKSLEALGFRVVD